jgi:hypothetical protein
MFNLSRAFTYLSLLGVVSQSLGSSGARIQRRQTSGPSSSAGPSPFDLPADAKKLSNDCQDILYAAGVTAEFKASKANTDEYFVPLKLSATAKDVANILAIPSMRGVKAIQTYTKEYDRGFSAKLTYEQVCALYKDARVSILCSIVKEDC